MCEELNNTNTPCLIFKYKKENGVFSNNEIDLNKSLIKLFYTNKVTAC